MDVVESDSEGATHTVNTVSTTCTVGDKQVDSGKPVFMSFRGVGEDPVLKMNCNYSLTSLKGVGLVSEVCVFYRTYVYIFHSLDMTTVKLYTQ